MEGEGAEKRGGGEKRDGGGGDKWVGAVDETREGGGEQG